jgi:uracil-DNA glycosylase
MDGVIGILREEGRIRERRAYAFGHGVRHDLDRELALFASYHPSQQNTFTGRLTASSFDGVLREIREHVEGRVR